MKNDDNIKAVSLSSQPFATPEKIHDIAAETYKNIKTQLSPVHRSMALYLANRDTEVILFKPVKVIHSILKFEREIKGTKIQTIIKKKRTYCIQINFCGC